MRQDNSAVFQPELGQLSLALRFTLDLLCLELPSLVSGTATFIGPITQTPLISVTRTQSWVAARGWRSRVKDALCFKQSAVQNVYVHWKAPFSEDLESGVRFLFTTFHQLC